MALSLMLKFGRPFIFATLFVCIGLAMIPSSICLGRGSCSGESGFDLTSLEQRARNNRGGI